MKIAASSCCWWHDSLDEVIRKAPACGFADVELLTFPPELFDLHGNVREMKPADLKKRLDDHGLKLAALHLGCIRTNTEELRRSMTDYAKLAIQLAQELGCGIIVEGGPDRGVGPFEAFLESIEELAEGCEGTNVKIALENHFGNSIQFIEDYDLIFKRIRSRAVGMTLDTGHFTSAKVDPVEVARRFATRVYHVHIKDHIGTRSVALGTGQTDNFGVARVLKSAGYKGYLSQELEVSDRENTDRYACEGLEYLRKLVAV